MAYSILKAPFELNFREMKREHAREFLEWFVKQIPERILVLARYITQKPRYGSWKGDLSPGSLDLLGEWFCENVAVRAKSAEEISAMNLPGWLQQITGVQTVLTAQTMNFAIDVSMYFAQTLITNNPSIHWDLVTKPKSVDYQQPVLYGRGKMFLNPVRILHVYANEIADRSQGPNRLRELYHIWSINLNE